MKLPDNAVIARAKVTHYLLVKLSRGDKSGFLVKGGYRANNADALLRDLRELRKEGEARKLGDRDYGCYYSVRGILPGTSGVRLRVTTIWMTERLSGITKFVTLIPIGVIKS